MRQVVIKEMLTPEAAFLHKKAERANGRYQGKRLIVDGKYRGPCSRIVWDGMTDKPLFHIYFYSENSQDLNLAVVESFRKVRIITTQEARSAVYIQ